jgi:hypothetical protein
MPRWVALGCQAAIGSDAVAGLVALRGVQAKVRAAAAAASSSVLGQVRQLPLRDRVARIACQRAFECATRRITVT